MPILAQAQFGPLPAATYTYEVYEVASEEEPPALLFRSTFAVAGTFAAIPALSRPFLAILAGILAGVAAAILSKSH